MSKNTFLLLITYTLTMLGSLGATFYSSLAHAEWELVPPSTPGFIVPTVFKQITLEQAVKVQCKVKAILDKELKPAYWEHLLTGNEFNSDGVAQFIDKKGLNRKIYLQLGFDLNSLSPSGYQTKVTLWTELGGGYRMELGYRATASTNSLVGFKYEFPLYSQSHIVIVGEPSEKAVFECE